MRSVALKKCFFDHSDIVLFIEAIQNKILSLADESNPSQCGGLLRANMSNAMRRDLESLLRTYHDVAMTYSW
jgi:hypothetical protein